MTVVASLTLLPALLGFAGDRIEVTRWRGVIATGFARPRPGRASASRSRPLAGAGFLLAIVTILAGFVVAAAEAGGAAPAAEADPRDASPTGGAASSSTTRGRPPSPAPSCCSCSPSRCSACASASPTRATSQEDTTTRQAYDLLVDGFGPGFNGPFFLAARVDGAGRPGRARGHHRGRRRRPRRRLRVAGHPERLQTVADRRYLWRIIPTHLARRTRPPRELVHRLRDDVLVDGETALGTEIAVTGSGAAAPSTSPGFLGRPHAVLLRGRAARVVPAADGRVPVGARAAQGRDHEPAVDRRRLRHHGGDLPVGLAQRHHRPRARSHRDVRAR